MSSSSQSGESFGLVGMGGYAGSICRGILGRTGPQKQKLRLTAVHDPAPENFPELLAQLQTRDIAVYKTYEELLASPIKALWLPLPIDLHRSFTEKALSAGKAVLCEKPAAGCVQDVDAMSRARDAAKLPVAVGYQHLYVDSTHQIKRHILDGGEGGLGKITDVTICSALARNSTYFARTWAGKLQRNGIWLLDSPANNAIAHFIHLALFLLGPEPMTSARPIAVEAELYRVNNIENYDTCCIRLTLEHGPKLLICMTHATRELRPTSLTLHGNKQKLTYTTDPMNAIWQSNNPAAPLIRMTVPHPSHPQVLTGFEEFLHNPTKPHASLEMSRMHALAISGAPQAAPVITLKPPFHQVENRGSCHLNYIPGIAALFDFAIETRQMLHETALAPWTVPARKLDLRNYTEFTGPPKA